MQKQANQKLSPSAAIEFIRAYKDRMNGVNDKMNLQRIKRMHELEERKKARRDKINDSVSDKMHEKYSNSDSKLFSLSEPTYDDFENVPNLEKHILESNKKDQKLLDELSAKERELENDLFNEINSEIEGLEKTAADKLAKLELAGETRKLEILKTSNDEDVEKLLNELETQQSELMQNSRNNIMKQRALLEAKLVKKRREMLIKNGVDSQNEIDQQGKCLKISKLLLASFSQPK